MKSITNYINEVKHSFRIFNEDKHSFRIFNEDKHSFRIKSHLKKEEQNNGYKIYKYMIKTGSTGYPFFVALTTEKEITAFNNYKNRDEKYNINEIISNNEWIAVWPDEGTEEINDVNMSLKYLNDEKIYKYVCDIDSFDDITLDYWKKLKTKY